MPTLKQLTCRIEIGPKNIQLREHGTSYGDGVVSTHVAVPSEQQNFSIHLTSAGYIASGLAMFVFIDGVQQCNRNRKGLVLPDKKTDKNLFEVDFRVRQKEDRFDDKSFIGREWSFVELQTTTAEEVLRLSDDVLQNVGTIEVVVLRCRDDANKRGSSSRPAIDDGRGMNLDDASDLYELCQSAMTLGLDGAADEYPISPPTEVKLQMFEEAQAAKEAGKLEQAADKDGANDDRGRNALAGLGRAFEKHGFSGYEDPPTSHRRVHAQNHGTVPNPWLGNPYLAGFYEARRDYARDYPHAYRYPPRAYDRHHSRRSSNETGRSNQRHDWHAAEGFEVGRHNTPRGGSRASSRGRGGGAWNTGDDKVDNSNDADQAANGGAVDASGSGWNNDQTNNATDSWNNQGDSNGNNQNQNNTTGNGWDNSNQNNSADDWANSGQNNQNGNNTGANWDTADQNNQNTSSWGNDGGNDNDSNSKDKKRAKQKKRGKKSRSASPATGGPIDPDKPHIKRYWTQSATKSASAPGKGKGGRDIYVVPEEPLLVVPEKFVQEQGIKHQVHAGKGKLYQHTTSTPKYIDTMTMPYAVFVFKYRSRETLEKMFEDVDIKEDREPYRDRIKDASREEVLEMLMKTKKAAGYGTDSDMSFLDRSDSSSSSETEDDKNGQAAEAKNGRDKTHSRKKAKENDEKTSGNDWGVQPAADTGGADTGKGKEQSWQQTVVDPVGGW